MEMFEKILTGINKFAPASTFSVAVATTIVIFVPNEFAELIGILDFRIDNNGPIGWTFILTYSYLISFLLWRIGKSISTRVIQGLTLKAHVKKLRKLTDIEKSYLSVFMEGKNTIYVNAEDGVIGGLQAKSIVYQSANLVDLYEGVPYNLQQWARDYLADNAQFLEGPEIVMDSIISSI